MTVDNILAALVLAVILGGALWYIIKSKKSGRKCIGCPDGCCSSPESCCGCDCSGCKRN